MSLAALLLAAAALPQDIYVRGGFNGWGTDNVMRERGNGVYEALVQLSPGNHAFKFGHKDWSAEWVINPSASVAASLDTDYTLDPHPGPHDTLFVKSTALYRFTINASNPAAPVLRITRVEQPAPRAIDPHLPGRAKSTLEFATWDGKRESATFSADNAILRGYTHSTTQQLRDPGPNFVRYEEYRDLPRVRSGNLAFDALFALAAHEMKQDSVRQIADGNYNGGAAVPCDCFETGEKWHYVWTRDLSYAATLGLGMLDPQRVRNSLDFKLSGFREGIVRAPTIAGSGDGLQIVQDTGSGGSWPVSTDRVSWAFGAEAALRALPAADRKAFAPRAFKALVNTIENDRLAAFDRATGLYTGEQSFLDWREQSYAAWIVDDIASMASAKALSTNVAHYKALTLAASLAQELGDAPHLRKYTQWAQELKESINTGLWLADAGLYSSLTGPHFNGAPMYKFDWLGQALAIVTGVADEEQAATILANYPHGPMGAPVIWPQQPAVPVYHNRAIWPFVTAFGLKAAAKSGNTAVADAAYATLMRGAALNLSNMENLEWLSGQPLLLDEKHPDLIGPVINSKRQLWSVGAYLGMVVENVFGISTTDAGIRIDPFITSKLRRETFAGSSEIVLHNLRLRDATLDVHIKLPAPSNAAGYYELASITLNGARVGDEIPWNALGSGVLEITLGTLTEGDEAIRRVKGDPYADSGASFAPPEPQLRKLALDKQGHAQLTVGGVPADAGYNVYKDGTLVAARVTAGVWTDTAPSTNACFTLETQTLASGNASHHSAPRCADDGLLVPVTDARIASNIVPTAADARFSGMRIKDWGKPGDTFSLRELKIAKAGNYALQIQYHNAANQINLGISGGAKWMSVELPDGRIVAQGVVQLPHAKLEKANTPLAYSTPLLASLKPGVYKLSLSDFYNMSYLQSNSSFSAAGGVDGPSNKFDIYGVRLRAINKAE